jgi:hypothetical protein
VSSALNLKNLFSYKLLLSLVDLLARKMRYVCNLTVCNTVSLLVPAISKANNSQSYAALTVSQGRLDKSLKQLVGDSGISILHLWPPGFRSALLGLLLRFVAG